MDNKTAIEEGRSESEAWVRFSSLAFFLESAASFLNKSQDLLQADSDQYHNESLSFAIDDALEQTREAIKLLEKAPD